MEKGEKIIHVVHSFYPVVGGIEKAVYEVAKRQSKKYDVTIITSSQVPNGKDDLHVVRIRSVRPFGMPDLTIPLIIPDLSEAKVVHYHSQNSFFSYRILSKHDNNVFTIMALNSLKSHPNPVIKILSPIYSQILIKRVLKYSKRLIVKNERDKVMLEEIYGKESYIIPDGVDDMFFTVPKTSSFKEKIGGDYVLYIGRLHPLKGVNVLIKASKKINSKVVFIGPGDVNKYEKIAQKEGVKDKCIFMNYVDDLTKIAAIDSSKAVIIPSISDYVEAFSIVLSEAWSREKTVIASSVGSLPYRISNGIDGILVRPNDPEILAETVNQVVENDINLGKEGRRKVLNWDNVTEMLEKVYEE
ncbi:glycosyltransferase family 4 protein [Acidianus brierleyi]|uniref:Glycosyltransferase family 1 protein n=1 Tax=Acidianus brierleyi TaxID=41673 RepID=A0A2U9ID95_9CREN|nr:glycosyltransferase family 4 protein [Acidianus brierleyi]AWR93976.1 glycosyltransferase [Acidianus brierleyi]